MSDGACTRSRTPSLPDDGSSSELLTSASLSLRSLTFSEELNSDVLSRVGSLSIGPHSSNASASASTLASSTPASSVSDCASAIWKAVGGGQGGDVWEADGIWKEIDGGVALLNDIEPSIGQQLMTEVRPTLHSTPFPNRCKVALAVFLNFEPPAFDHALTLCVMWITR
jgi:hypothetical protein